MTKRWIRRSGVAVTLALPALLAQAQSPEPPRDVPTFGVSTELVYVRFHVEKKGRYLDGLRPDQVRVFEDGRPQRIALLETPSTRERTIPPQVTLALDVSSSVMDAGLLDEALLKEAFFAGLSEQTSVGLCAFGGQLRCLTPPTRSVEELMDGFQRAVAFSHEMRREGTRLYASAAEIFGMKPEGERAQRAVVIFSDGLDNRGGKVTEAIQAAAEADVAVYAVKLSQAFQDTAPARARGGFGGSPNRAIYDYKKFDLDRLAEETGGRAYEPGTLDRNALGEILRSIATEVTMENVLGYEPEGPATGRKRKIKVELVDKTMGKIRDGERTLVR
ncbi:MAG TPA: VWA domain-containing protein [Vicinamibacteria bacterium]|nr:VWA domain-containing protein [Vicinamibacteria bacterium]